MEKKQTAVEWLVRKVSNELIGEIPMHRWDEIRDVVQQAKEMEKEQITQAFLDGEYFSHDYFDEQNPYANQAQNYYNENYGKETDRS